MSEWLVAIGTFLLALTAALQDRIRSKLWSPELHCEIGLNPPDCHRTVASDYLISRIRLKNISSLDSHVSFLS
jgi:hypothetical protein